VTTSVKGPTSRLASAQHKPQVLQISDFKKIPWLVHGFSTRPSGVTTCYGDPSLNLGFTNKDARENVLENRKRLLLGLSAATRGKLWPLVVNRQVHSDVIHVVRETVPDPLAGDGLVTNVHELALAILTADCLSVLIVDKKNRAVGAFHAGWRGTVKRIVEKGVGIMRREFDSRPEDLLAAIGPGIQKCCYEVGEELKAEFQSQFAYAQELFHEVQDSEPVREKYPLLFLNARAPGHGDLCIKLHLDLSEANRRQLLAAGLKEKNITVSGECTACNTQTFFSHRAERGNTGRMMAVIGIAPLRRSQ
jgi:polyphenol oxidase